LMNSSPAFEKPVSEAVTSTAMAARTNGVTGSDHRRIRLTL
jgi:hypothetical protein